LSIPDSGTDGSGSFKCIAKTIIVKKLLKIIQKNYLNSLNARNSILRNTFVQDFFVHGERAERLLLFG
jgi:hypothetical protein